MTRNLVALAAAALLASTVATNAVPAGHGGFGGGHSGQMGGRFGGPLIGSAPMTSPIYNPSTPYTVPQSPEVGVSPAS
jgi:hypothetical protein